MRTIIITIVVVIALVLLVVFSRSSPAARPIGEVEIAATIIRTDVGFSPAQVSIKKGQAVTFINSSQAEMWPASDMHPTHDDYPDFDPGEPIKQGGSWTFVFERAGAWAFHDHLRSNRTGKVIVE